MEPWQWFVGTLEFIAAWTAVECFVVWRRHPSKRSVNIRYCSRCGWPITARVHTKGMCLACQQEQSKLAQSHTCVRCRRMGSLGTYADDGTGWICATCVAGQLPEKAAIWQTYLKSGGFGEGYIGWQPVKGAPGWWVKP